MPELPEKADLLKHLLKTAADGLPVCGDQHYGETSKNRDNGRPARLVRTASLVTGEGTNCCPSRTTSTTQMDPETAWFPIRPVQDIPVEELPLLSAFRVKPVLLLQGDLMAQNKHLQLLFSSTLVP